MALQPIPFKYCPPDLMKKCHNGNSNIPTAYFHSSGIIRWLFYARLRQAMLLTRHLETRDSCLDVGCGGGALFPSISSGFRRVVGLDCDIETAQRVRDEMRLTNIQLTQEDLFNVNIQDESFDAIFALDIIEHLDNVSEAIDRLFKWINPGGLLIICIPTENRVYNLGRKLFGFTRPSDHHYVQPLQPLLETYFSSVRLHYWPLPVCPLAQFYLICARKAA